VTIDYTYDNLYRLTKAEYSTGEVFEYTYDVTGNRLSQEVGLDGELVVTTYTYDDANRLIEVDAQAYTWDANGRVAPLRRCLLPPKRDSLLTDRLFTGHREMAGLGLYHYGARFTPGIR